MIIATSSALICICINLWFFIRLVPKTNESEDEQRKSKIMFFIIGITLMISGLVINLALVLATKILTPSNLSSYTGWSEDFDEYTIRPAICLSLFFTGLLSLSIASSYRETRKAALFLLSLGTMAATIIFLICSVQMYDEAFRHESNLPIGHVTKNSTEFCIGYNHEVSSTPWHIFCIDFKCLLKNNILKRDILNNNNEENTGSKYNVRLLFIPFVLLMKTNQ